MLLNIIILLAALILLALLILWLVGERGHPLRPSTRSMIRQGGWRRFLNLSALHGYIYGRWTNKYVSFLIHRFLPKASQHKLAHLANHYHGKVLTPEHAHAIINNKNNIPLQDLEQIIPYSSARNIVLNAPTDIAVYECACRHARQNPCNPTLVCMVIGQPFVDFILEHHPKSSRRLSQNEALQLLHDEHKRGHLHSAWFKDALLDRFYAICNCCKCCCAGIEAMVKYGAPVMAPSGFVARHDQQLCKSCQACIRACPFNAISINENIHISWDKCMGCGVCISKCSQQAISLARDERKGSPLDVRLLSQPPTGA